jgi:tetratricopeptide (TPR) repeat protein
MSGLGGEHYRRYIRNFARGDYEEALAATDAALQATPAKTPGDRIMVGAMALDRGAVLQMLGRFADAQAEFLRGEALLDQLTYAARMAVFYAEIGGDLDKASHFCDTALRILAAKEATGQLDDGEAYYRRAMIEIREESTPR